MKPFKIKEQNHEKVCRNHLEKFSEKHCEKSNVKMGKRRGGGAVGIKG
jgi:hypothetical protein